MSREVVLERIPAPLESLREGLLVVTDLCSEHGWTSDARKFVAGAVLLLEPQDEKAAEINSHEFIFER